VSARNRIIGLALSLAMVIGISSDAMAKARIQDPRQFCDAGDQFMQQGRYLDAAQQYSKALKIDKRNPKLYQARVAAELSASKFKQASSDATKAIKFAPDDPYSYELRSRAYDALKQYKKEIVDLNKLLSMNPNNGAYLLQRAQTSIALKQMNDVIQDCNKAITMGLDRNQLGNLYKMRSIAYKKLGKKQEAQQENTKYQSLQ